jgi:hypothetical protein
MSGWTKEWPTEPGWYWFYGHMYGEEKCNYGVVEVRRITNGVTRIMNGQFMFQAEGHYGHFIPLELPAPPEE